MPVANHGLRAGGTRRRRARPVWVMRFRLPVLVAGLYLALIVAVLAAVAVWPGKAPPEPEAIAVMAPGPEAGPLRGEQGAGPRPPLLAAAWRWLVGAARHALLTTGTLKGALRAGLPGLAAVDPPRLPLAEGEPLGRRFLALALNLTTGAEAGRPWTLLAAQLPGGLPAELPEPGPAVVVAAPLLPRWDRKALAEWQGGTPAGTPPDASPGEGGTAEPVPGLPSAAAPVVFIYHTHGSEAYLGDVPASTASRADALAFSADPATSIMRVGEVMAERLTRRGVAALHLRAFFDRSGGVVNRFFSYAWARRALQDVGGRGPLTKAYPSLRLVVDIHRDHVPGDVDSSRARTTAVIGGRAVARVLFVVGGDHAGARNNYCLALALADLADRLYPGLSRGVKLAAGKRYNQDLAPAALLLEMGSTFNTLAEAERAAELMADVIAEAYRRGMLPEPGRPYRCPQPAAERP